MYFLFSGRLLGRNTTSFSYLGAPATRTFSLDMALDKFSKNNTGRALQALPYNDAPHRHAQITPDDRAFDLQQAKYTCARFAERLVIRLSLSNHERRGSVDLAKFL